MSRQCKKNLDNNSRCKNTTDSIYGYCYTHEPKWAGLFVGGGVGALVGSFFFPPIGTAVGMGVSSLIGHQVQAEIEKRRNQRL